MTSVTLFGLALAPLYAAIAQVESEDGATSANVYQIDEDGSGYTDDVNRILTQRYRRLSGEATALRQPLRLFTREDALCRSQAEYMMAVYWSHWGGQYQMKTGRPVTYEVLARIHNGGPLGWKKAATRAYWNKVLAAWPKEAK